MNQNLVQMAQLLKGKNPQQLLMQLVQNQKINDPIISELISYAQNGDTNSFVNLASAVFAQNGLDLNNEFMNFMQLMQ